MNALYSVVAIVAAWLVGSVSFAVLVSKAMGLADPRTYGSKNPGATNVLRSGNRTAAVLTLFGDAAKGFVPVFVAKALAARFGFGDGAIALVGLAAFAGHLFPAYQRLRHGGKGVATAAGVLLAFSPALGGAVLVAWLLIAFFFRYSSLAALVAAVCAPLLYLFMFRPDPLAAAIGVMSALLIWRHAGNIRNLLAGKESRIGGRK